MGQVPDRATTGTTGAADSPEKSRGIRSCPSAPCIEGALLLGVMTDTGRLAYVQPPVRVDAEFVANARARGHPERRFRFSLPCIEKGCSQWTGTRCGLADKLVEEVGSETEATRLPACAIRGSCRWFAQHAAKACAVCPLVVADVGGIETYRSTHAVSAAKSTPQQST
jgi:hypothetical protein